MKILVYAHDLAMGGSQINAIELAAATRDFGHEVTLTAPPGVLAASILDLGLPYVPTPVSTYYPSVRTARHLSRLVRDLSIDVVHAYEWRPAVEATFGPHLRQRTPLLFTVLSMSVPNYLPRHVPLIVGTRELAAQWVADRTVYLMEPPIDTELNRNTSSSIARARWNLDEDEIVLSVVCRLTHDLEKLEGVLTAMHVVWELSEQLPLRLLIVGDGEGFSEVEHKANSINQRAGRELIIAAGQMMDPRQAYDAADIVLGMGSSALKGMAFSKPLIVQGTSGFWKLLQPETLPIFFEQGWFGHGGNGANDLAPIIRQLAADKALRMQLGVFGRGIVEEHFSLAGAAAQLDRIYEMTVAATCPAMRRIPALLRSAARISKFRAVNAIRAVRARAAS